MKEEKRIEVLNRIGRGDLTAKQGSAILELSLRQVRRLLATYKAEGVIALIHGNRGRKPAHALDESVRTRVVDLAKGKYAGFNTQHFTESLAEREQINLSRSTVRNILSDAGQGAT